MTAMSLALLQCSREMSIAFNKMEVVHSLAMSGEAVPSAGKSTWVVAWLKCSRLPSGYVARQGRFSAWPPRGSSTDKTLEFLTKPNLWKHIVAGQDGATAWCPTAFEIVSGTRP